MVNFCPNSLFTNTKADIGPCNLVHDDYLKREYQTKANKRERRAFEEDFIRFCQGQLNEVERKIKRAKQRLESSQLERSTQSVGDSVISEQCLEKLNSINEKIEKVLEEIEQLGCQGKYFFLYALSYLSLTWFSPGKVEEAQEAMKLLDQLKEKKASLKRENHSGHWIQQKAEIGVAQEKQMEVCDVCGAFLIVNDVQQRVEDHLQGKQHVGYGRLKSALEDLVEKRKKGYAHSTEERSRHDRDHRKGDSRGRFRERDRYQEHRGRAKDHFRRSRSRSRSPDKSNHRAMESPERRRSSHFNSSTK